MTREEYFDRNYNFDEIDVDPRFIRCEKEMKITFAIWIIFAVLSIGLAYYLGRGPSESYRYIMGLPQWWFAAIVVTVIFSGIVIYITKFVFQDMPLDDIVHTTDKKPVLESEFPKIPNLNVVDK